MTAHPETDPAALLDAAALRAQAIVIIRENDRGAYTIPTKGLYPYQWNWDSCFTALGFSHFDHERAWVELETLFAHQWPDGMVPHIIFHVFDPGYFPGPEVWRTGRPTPTSGITQNPVAGLALRRLYERAADRAAVRERARALLLALDRWHAWFYACRDPAGEGLVAILHPWESRDNSVDWDEAFARVPTAGLEPYTRQDTRHADPAHRPTQTQYDRFIWLVQHFRSLGWDNRELHDASPFQIVDPGFNAYLIRGCMDAAWLADELGEADIATANRARAAKGLAALDRLWSERHGQYLCFDRARGTVVDSPSCGGLLAVSAPIPAARAQSIARRIAAIGEHVPFLVPSHHPDDSRFEPKRYWRGPIWLVCNYLIADGLRNAGESELANAVAKSSLDLIGRGGFAEYYDPTNGSPCGGGRFTWTAAMVLEFVAGGGAMPIR
jgi:hypothetical protein